MKTLTNKHKYLTKELVNTLFTPNQITHVDKVQTGNGATTAFFNIEPKEGSVNIIILPNNGALDSKQEKYKNRTDINWYNKRNTDIGSKSTIDEDTKILVFVIDSFINTFQMIKGLDIDKLLVDEYHTIQQQSIFRRNLINFEVFYLQPLYLGEKNISVTTITATPNQHATVDIKIINELQPKMDVDVISDEEYAIDEIKERLSNDEKVVIYSNDAKLIGLLAIEGALEINTLVCGEGFARTACKNATITLGKGNLTICSSSGWEGLDIHGDDYHSYFFLNFNADYTSSYISNLYQAFSRTRNGSKTNTLIRVVGNRRLAPYNESAARQFIYTDKISNEKKQNSKNYKGELKDIIKFFVQGDESRKAVLNEDAIELRKEMIQYAYSCGIQTEFIDDRKITFNEKYVGIPNNAVRFSRRNATLGNIRTNKALINRMGLDLNTSYDPQLNPSDASQGTMSKQLASARKMVEVVNTFKSTNREPLEKESILLDVLTPRKFKVLLNDIYNENKKYYIKKLGEKVFKERKDVPIWKYGKVVLVSKSESIQVNQPHITNNIINLLLGYGEIKPTLRKKIVGARDYNETISMSLGGNRVISEALGTHFEEIDVSSCFPRVICAKAGITLTKDFYGMNKENKIGINAWYNTIWYDEDSKTSRSVQKRNLKRKGEKLGLPIEFIEWCLGWFDKSQFKGDLYNSLQRDEAKIIRQLTKEMQALDSDCALIRRHDSVLNFDFDEDKRVELNRLLRNFTYLEVNGWFDYDKDNISVTKGKNGALDVHYID